MKHLTAFFLALTLITFSSRASADNPGREFLMSCTYGVLAGTLVGAATLAFESRPGDHLNHIARGASWGLYAGILLGFYVVYIVPGLDKPEEEQLPAFLQKHPFDVAPVMNPAGGMDGMQASITITHF
jgi:NhaP-type Na+/H+ or K+/H+ antiporter